MNSIYYIIIIITVVSYLLGLFLAYFEKKGKINVLSQMGNAGFVNIYGINKPIPEYNNELEEVAHKIENSENTDEEII